MRTCFYLVLLLIGVAVAAGCDPEERIAVQKTTRVHVRDVDGERPVAGVKIVLMQRSTNTPLAVPLRSGDDGICEFPVMPTGDETVLAFGGDRLRVFGAPGYHWTGKADGGVLDPATPPAYADGLVRMAAIPAPGGAHISGTVVDAGTGAPLAGAFLSQTPYPDAYNANIGPSDDVTLADGAFRVSRILFAVDPRTGRLSQAVPLWVTRHGYRPRMWRYEPHAGEDVDEIMGVRIALTRDVGGERGALRGRLLRGDAPASRVWVGLGWAGLPGGKAGAGLTGWTARSDSAGEFVFTDLPVGRYVVHPGFLPDDGAFYPDQPANVAREVTADTETDAGDFQLVWEIRAEFPHSGASVPAATLDFNWSAVPDAVSYVFRLDRGDPVRVDAPHHRLPQDDLLAPGNHFWYVVGVNAQEEIVAAFAALAEFRVPASAGD